MHEFITKYKTDKVFREFIDELIDSNSTLWHEYAIEKTYNALVEHEDDIINDPTYLDLVKPLSVHIDTVIEYYKSKEEYEKCNKLNTIKKYLL